MLKRYTFWLTAAVIFQFLTAVIHGITLFVAPEPANETERQLNQITSTYQPDLGPVFHPTVANLITALSSCFSFACLVGGLSLGYLLTKHAEPKLMRGLIGINLCVFGLMFAVMLVFTFLPPIILTGLIFVNLLVAFLTVPRIEAKV